MGFSAGAWAADDDGAEATIRLMGTAEAELPDAVTRQITLPKDLLVESNDQVKAVNKAKGLDKANERVEKREKGLQKADAVREHGALGGLKLTLKRLLRCHPWHPGGLDPVPPHHCSRSSRGS